jgi:hypothetical protein
MPPKSSTPASINSRQIVTVPARLARPQRRPILHLPAHWPWADHWTALWHKVFGPATEPPAPA